jgi:hypothetical protein
VSQEAPGDSQNEPLLQIRRQVCFLQCRRASVLWREMVGLSGVARLRLTLFGEQNGTFKATMNVQRDSLRVLETEGRPGAFQAEFALDTTAPCLLRIR